MINIFFVKDECEQDDLAKYEDINKLLIEVDTPCLDQSKKDNKVKTKFVYSFNDHTIENKSIPERIKYYTWLLQKKLK